MNLLTLKNSFILSVLFVLCWTTGWAATDAGTEPKQKPLFADSPSLKGEPKELTTGVDDGMGDALSRMMVSLTIVILLGAAVLYASKKVLPKFSQVSGKRIKVIETVSLGSRRAVHLLQVDGQQILIGTTPDAISKLADIHERARRADDIADKTDTKGPSL